jgi:hypothetical protein
MSGICSISARSPTKGANMKRRKAGLKVVSGLRVGGLCLCNHSRRVLVCR